MSIECCVYHKPRKFDESDSEESDYEGFNSRKRVDPGGIVQLETPNWQAYLLFVVRAATYSLLVPEVSLGGGSGSVSVLASSSLASVLMDARMSPATDVHESSNGGAGGRENIRPLAE